MLRADPCRVDRQRGRRGWYLAAGAGLCAALVGGLVSPAWAAAPPDGGGDVQLGSFALGDGLEGAIGELDGAFSFSISAGGVLLAWDSRAAAADPVRLGGGWSFGLSTIQVSGGVWVHPVSGGAFPMSATSPSGLAGYPGSDVVFAAAEPGAVVPARPDGSGPETPYAYVLHELGGVSTYYDAAGHPVAKLVEGGDRLDWRWEAGGTGRLLAIVSADGSVTALDWSDPSRLVIEPGSNVTDPVEGSGAGGRWVVELDGGRVSEVAGPGGESTRIGYDRAGLVEQVSTPSGASTAVQWRASTDGVARVARVRVVDDVSGAELSVREWGVQGEAAPSGWPFVDAAATAGALPVGGTPGYEAWLSDGKTRVESAVDARQRLTARSVAVTSSGGERVLQEQAFTYPEQDAAAGTPAGGTKPTSATTTQYGRHGTSRSASESYAFDEFGRMVGRTTVEGATTRRTYDDEIAPGRPLPVGLMTDETTTTADGLVSSVRSELSEDRTTVVTTEQWSGREGGELVRVGRVETDIDGGFLTEERVFPGGDPAAVPVVTRWSKQVDLPRGVTTVVQTDAAGTPIEASASSVASLVHGGVLSSTDEVGNVTSARFDEAGRQVATEDVAGRKVTREYLSRQVDGVNAVRVTAHTGVVETETLDVLGRVVRRSDNIAPSGHAEAGFERVVESHEYDAPGVERVIDAWGATTTTERDVFGREQRVTLANGLVQVAEYDDVAGSATSGVSPSGDLADAPVTSTTTRDLANTRVTTSGARADGVAVPEATTEFDGLGRPVSSMLGERRSTTEYDEFGNAVATNVAASADGSADAGVTAERRFDGFGVSVEKTLRSATETSAGPQRVLDELGRVVSETDQSRVAEHTGYTPDGLVAEVVSGTGQVRAYEYDPQTRRLIGARVSSPHGATVETSYRYDEAGRLIAVFDPADEAGTIIRYESDDFGNRTRTTYPDGSEIRNEFDPNGRKTATIDVAGNRTAYTYDDADGSLVRALQTAGDGAQLAEVRYGYDDFGRVSSVERGNGIRTDYTFTSTAQIATEVTTGPAGVLSEREYTYSPAGLVTGRIDRVRGDAGRLEATRTEYEYDLHERLVGSHVRDGDAPDGPVVTRTEYVPTVRGDLASETVTSAPDTADAVTTTRRFEYSTLGELIAISTDGDRREQRYDADGSLVASAEGDRYVYDAASRVIAQTTQEGLQIDTSYWADGSRREYTTAAGSTRYYWDGEALLNDSHQATVGASGTASYLTGTSRQARTVQPEGASPSTSYYGTDRHGNVTELIDEAGAITTRYAYTDYGVATATGDRSAPLPGGIGELAYNPFQYAGEYTYRDGTQPLGPRIYDTSQARFLTEDDASLVNLYAFGELNPITKVDPSGRTSVLDWARSSAVTAGFAFALLGAALFVSSAFTGGISGLSAFGIFSGLVAGGDAVLAGFEFAAITGKVEWIDQHAVEIASWAFAATSAALAIGGVVTRIGTSLNWKFPMSEVDEILSLENTIQKRVASLGDIDDYLDGLPVGYEDLSYLSTKLEVHSALAKTYTQDIRAMGTIAAPGNTVTLTPTQRLTRLRGLDAEIVSRGKAIRAELEKATKALTGSELSNDPTRTVKQDLANLKTARGKADGVIDPNSGTLEQVGHADDIPDELTGNTNDPTTFGTIPIRTDLNVGGDPFN